MNRSDQSRPKDPLDEYLDRAEQEAEEDFTENLHPQRPSAFKRFLKVAIIVVAGLLIYRAATQIIAPAAIFTSVATSGPSEDLLNRMGASMTDMGYGEFSHDELRDLRSDGLTATYIRDVRALGYDELTLEQARQMGRASVSVTFLAMMQELGYELTPEEAVRLRSAGVTAAYTSRVHDLGYTDVTTDQLHRMRTIGVSTNLIEDLKSERGEGTTLEEVIRYRISNQ